MSDLSGTTLRDRYFLRRKIGAGGMAEVYLAWDTMRSATMAIKVLRRDLENSHQLFNLFAKEAQILRKLEHPHIVRLYEFDRDGDLIFIVMDWVEGQNLREIIAEKKKPLNLDEVSKILDPVCSALDYAHKNRVYHCDIKPANILRDLDKRVYVSDFGMARLAAERPRGGTPPYMAPEQISRSRVDARTDVYGLGITLYAMLSGGEIPFKGDSPSSHGSTVFERIEWEHMNLPVPPLRRYNSRISKAVERVVVTALRKDPNQRYDSTIALRNAFEKARSESSLGRSLMDTFFVPEEKKSKQAGVAGLQSPPPPRQPKSSEPTQKPKKPSRTKAIRSGKHLVGSSGEWAGKALPLPRGGLTIGRSRSNQLQIHDRSVSRTHARIIFTRHGVYIKDENSTYGTYVNGQRIYRPVQLKHGDRIQFGYGDVFEYRER